MPNPVEILGRAARRIAQVAAARTFAYAILPAVVATALAFSLHPLAHLTWERWGYVLGGGAEQTLFDGLLAVAGLMLAGGFTFAAAAYLRARDLVAVAERVDEAVGGRQQILTLATLADPSAPDSAKRRRSPLFPVLWNSAAAFLESFDPRRAFPLDLGRSITRSSVLASAIALGTILAAIGLIRTPTPLQAQASRLRELAAEIESTSSGPGDLAMAEMAREAADALEDPKLTPEEKKQRIEEVMRQMASHSEERQGGGKEKGKGAGGGSAQNGKGSGSGQGQSEGKSNGSGNGSAKNGEGKGASRNDKGRQGDDKRIELQNELSKAEAQIETEGASNQNPNSQPGGEKDRGEAPEGGKTPEEKAQGSQPSPRQPGSIPTQSAQGNRNVPQSGTGRQPGKDQGSNLGDTHLGEFPTPAQAQRYLKPGEKGGSLDIHDARYVMFRLPSATPVGSGGTTVIDPHRTKATTPYVNAPLKETSSDAPPDERQLVPPRYRDLIH